MDEAEDPINIFRELLKRNLEMKLSIYLRLQNTDIPAQKIILSQQFQDCLMKLRKIETDSGLSRKRMEAIRLQVQAEIKSAMITIKEEA